MIKIEELEINGTKVAIYPMQEVRTIVVRVKLYAGSWYENGPEWGAMHLLEHMTFQGTKKFPKMEDVEIFREENAIYTNAWTGGSSIEYMARFPDVSLEAGFELLFECIFDSTFPEEKMEKEKKIVRQEYQDKWSKVDARFGKKIKDQLYGKGHKYTRDGLGNPDYVDKITREDLVKIYEEYFCPANMVIGIAGAVEVGTVKKMLEKVLDRKKGLKQGVVFEMLQPEKKRMIHKEEGKEVVSAYWMWPTKGDNDISFEDSLKMSVASYILGGGFHSVILKKLRHDLGLVYKAGWVNSQLPTTGTFEAWASVSPENLAQVEEEVKKIYREFLEKPIPSDVFERAIKYLNLGTLMGFDSVESITGRMIDQLFWDGRTRSAEDIINISNTFKEEEIRRVVKENIIDDDPFVSLMMKK